MFDPIAYPNCYKGLKYAEDVISGKIISNIYIKAACNRFFKDLEKSQDENNWYYFSIRLAENYLVKVQRFKHVKGKWKSPYIIYEPWQCFIFMNIHGFRSRVTNYRRFRRAHVEIARGNAKSAMASQAALFALALEEPNGNEIYSAATSSDQARITLDSARAMATANKSYRDATGVAVYAHHIAHAKSNSFFKALSSKADNLDGKQPYLQIIDELHAHKTRDVFDVCLSGMSKRKDSLLLVITTAGFNTANIGYDQSKFAKKLLLGEIEDDKFFSVVYTLDDEDDVMDENNWIKANPNLHASVDIEQLRSFAIMAKESPASMNNFKVKHLNIWTNAHVPYFNTMKWDSLADKNMRMEDFKGKRCYVAIDLASKIDLASMVYIFNENNKYQIFQESFCPEETIAESSNEYYLKWVESGRLIATPGAAINYPMLQDKLEAYSKIYKIQAVHYDPWNANEFAQRMLAKRINMVEFKMNTANLSEPMKKLDSLIRDSDIIHNGDDLLKWCLGNVVSKPDANDNVFPRKDSMSLKIDPVVASIMAIAGFMDDEANRSIYSKRGIISF